MDCNQPYSLRNLGEGKFLLCDPEGVPVCVDRNGRARLHETGRFMTLNDVKERRIKRGETGINKVELEHYHDVIRQYYNPRFNVRTQEIELNGSPLSEEDFEALNVSAARDYGLGFSKGNLQAVVRSAAVAASYDPIYTYLDGLGIEGAPILTDSEWDQIAVLTLGLEDSYSRVVVQKTLLAAAQRVLDPGCKVDFCTILYGEQGLGKSTFFRALAGDSFSDSMGPLDKVKDELMIMHRYWFNEWSEADQIFLGARASEQIKRFVSAQEDSFRAPYGRTVKAYPRRSVLCGTTNRDDWANDPTGNRRFPVLSPKAIDIDWIKENRDRIWAYVVVQLRRGARWWFDKEEEARITQQASDFAPTNDDVEVAFAYLSQHAGEWMSTRDVLIQALKVDSDRLDQPKVSRLARQMSALMTRGVLREKRNYTGRTAQSPTRIRTTCWKAVPPSESVSL